MLEKTSPVAPWPYGLHGSMGPMVLWAPWLYWLHGLMGPVPYWPCTLQRQSAITHLMEEINTLHFFGAVVR